MFPNPIPRGIAWPSTAVLEWMRTRVRAAGADPTTIPDEPVSFWRLKEVIRRTGCSRSTIQRFVEAGQFPKPVTLRAVETERSAV
jgi:predicted DNA-binding transcriptional regulator AlpA